MALWALLVLLLTAQPTFGQTELDQVLDGFSDAPSIDFTGTAENGRIDDIDSILAGFGDEARSVQQASHDDIDSILAGFGDETEPPPTGSHDDIDGVLAGFGDDAGPVQTGRHDPALSSEAVRIGGRISQRLIYNFAHRAPLPAGVDHRGLSSFRTRLDLEVEADLGPDWRAIFEGHGWFDGAADHVADRLGRPRSYRDTHVRGAEIGEFLVQGPLSDRLDLTIGRQIMVWGRSDMFRVTDILNPVDSRLPGLTDIEDLRLPVLAVRLDHYSDPWTIGMMAIPERRFDMRPASGSDFHAGAMPAPPRDMPGSRFGAPELAASLTGTFPGWDISFHVARVFDDRPHLRMTEGGEARLRHNRISMMGVAGNVVSGNWLIKAEAAAYTGLRFSNVTDREFTRLSVLAGVEYSGIENTAIAFEATNGHIREFDERLRELPDDRRRNEMATALRVTRSLRNDAFDVSFLALTFGPTGKEGAMQRIQLDHELSDAVQLSAGIALYRDGNRTPFRNIDDNDRLFASIEYHF